MKVLGIETSCDETSAAVVDDGPRLLAQVVLSQSRLHERFGGVVPEVACRSHVESLTSVVEQALADANVRPTELEAIAVAHRPGLIGALLVGVSTAKALAWAWDLPLIAVDHLEAHLEAPCITGKAAGTEIVPPFLGVVLSGGHTDLYRVDAGSRTCIGQTRDDAVGEAFDKVANVLGLGYPGGPAVEREAKGGDPTAVVLPRTLLDRESLDFSFSGLKTAVLYSWRGQKALHPGPVPDAPSRPDLAASFQAAVGDVLITKLSRAIEQTGLRRLVFGGGVTANRYLRERIERELANDTDLIAFPAPEFSTDNGAMIAAMGQRLLREGKIASLYLDATPTR